MRGFLKSFLVVGYVAASASLVSSCGSAQVMAIATSDNPEKTAKYLAKQRGQAYKRNPGLLVQDVRTVKRNYKRLRALLRGEVEKAWGPNEILIPTPKRYVKYTENYLSRARVDFDSGRIVVETLDGKQPVRSLRNAILTTLLTPEDPRGVDLYSANTVKLGGTPYLRGLVRDQHGRLIDGPDAAQAYADYLSEREIRQRAGHGPGKHIHYVEFHMVSDHMEQRALRYAPLVRRQAERFRISRGLVFAVIKTESDFNPFAVSGAPAYGLMQLVPTSGGRDAYRNIKGKDHIPSRDYLFNAANNIELGTGYLSIISDKYLGRIRDPLAREYCTIAAYNTGAGNVLRTFSADRDKAMDIINTLSASQVYERLLKELEHAEARRYLYKVLQARKAFVNT